MGAGVFARAHALHYGFGVPMRKVPEMVAAMDPHQEIIVICHHGIRSRQVALFLEHQGFSNVVNLSGGLDAWARHTDTSLPTY